VVGISKLGESAYIDDIKRMDEKGELKRNLEYPPIKDTVTVPSGGKRIYISYYHIKSSSHVMIKLKRVHYPLKVTQ
jgi:hypothetical protein